MRIVLHEVRDGQEHEVLKQPHVLVDADGHEHQIVEPIVGEKGKRDAVFCKVSIGGKQASLSDLCCGMECELTIEDGKVTEVQA